MLSWVAHCLVVAAPVYIDGDAEVCPGEGTDAAPYCSLRDAVAQHTFEAGDELLLRDAAQPYDDELVEIFFRSGTAELPLVLAADAGHSPLIRHPVRFFGSSHWVVRDLTFDGSESTNLRAVEFAAGNNMVTNVRIENLDVRDWGGGNVDGSAGAAAAIAVNAGDEGDFTNVVIRGNRITNGKGGGISSNRVDEVLIEDNTIDGLVCAPGIYEADAAVVGLYFGGGRDASIRFNTIRSLDGSDCADGTARVAGVLLQGSDDTEIGQNWISDVGMGAGNGGMGLLTAQGSDDPWAHHNVIVDAEECGLCDDFTYSAGGVRTLFEHNTVVGGQTGVALYYPRDLIFRDNLITGASDFAVRMFRTPINPEDTTVLSWTLERNLYDAESGLFRLEHINDFDLAGWQDACNCDEASVDAPADLGLRAEDFTPSVSSPAIDLGDEAAREPFNGSAPDAGALEAPEIISATVRELEPDQILLVFGPGGTPPIRFDVGCSGFSVAVDGEPASPVGCESTGGAITIRLGDDVLAGQAVTLSYEGPWVRDSSGLGGVLDAVLQPQEIAVANESTMLGGAESSSGTGGSDESGSGSGSISTTGDPGVTSTGSDDERGGGASSGGAGSGAQGGFPSAQGCSLGNGSRPHRGLFLLLLGYVALLRRRRSSSALL